MDTIVKFSQNQARQTIKVVVNILKIEADSYIEILGVGTQALRAYYKQPYAGGYDLN